MSSIWRQLKTLKNAVDNELNDILETSISMIDLIGIGYSLLKDEINPVVDCENEVLIETYIETLLLVTQYIETDTVLESVIPDSLYDALYEKYKDMTGKDITGTPLTTSSSRLIREHRYPEARGSLDKVHFVRDKDIPKDDNKKSLEYWLRSVIKKCDAAGIPYKDAQLAADVKHDGLCAVFEFVGKKLDHVITRRDVELNQGIDITHIFKDLGDTLIDMLHFNGVPLELFECDRCGIKTEVMVSDEAFNLMQKEMTHPPKNRRSAASMILNTSKDEYNPDWVKYLTIQPLQLTVEGNKKDFSVKALGLKMYSWYYIGKINGRHQYIQPRMDHYGTDFTLGKLDTSLNLFETFIIDIVKTSATKSGTPTDGVVITIMDETIISLLGRENNRNKFQVAYKFPAGIKKTKLLDVEFQVGPIAGTITPVAKIEPIEVMGNTIVSPGLSNCEKMERLQLRKGDEVMIRYDIVPILYKDDTCKPGKGDTFKTPKTCPICEQGLMIKDATVRCVNLYCGARRVGRIYNYVNKLNMDGIGEAIIEDLVDIGALDTIGDLYRLEEHKDAIIELPGYGIKKYGNIITSINKQREFYPHQILGALGIPDIGRRMMERVCRVINPNVLLRDIFAGDKPVIAKLTEIDGIAYTTANKIYDGILMNKDVIEDLLHYVAFKEYEEKPKSDTVILFTKVRDKDFQTFLEEQDVEVVNGYSKRVTSVVVPSLDVISSKVTKAKEDGKEIISLDELKKRYNYKDKE